MEEDSLRTAKITTPDATESETDAESFQTALETHYPVPHPKTPREPSEALWPPAYCIRVLRRHSLSTSRVLLSDFSLTRLLHESTSSAVYLATPARHTRHLRSLPATVALNIVPTRIPRQYDRARYEFALRARIQPHFNVAHLFSTLHLRRATAFVTRLATEPSLADLQHKHGDSSVLASVVTHDTTLAVAKQLADAVSHCHARGFALRDVRPEHIMLSRPVSDAELWVGAFGIRVIGLGSCVWIESRRAVVSYLQVREAARCGAGSPFDAPERGSRRHVRRPDAADVFAHGAVFKALQHCVRSRKDVYGEGRQGNRWDDGARVASRLINAMAEQCMDLDLERRPTAPVVRNMLEVARVALKYGKA